ncbi:MAG: ATP-binding protein [Candidatus Electrothrix sp. ATG2]|nr:ATP-binding protein [Candidatus Electrothrix sp. ATG2]
MDDHDLAILYGSLVDLNLESFIDRSLTIFDDNILAIKQRATSGGVVLKLLIKKKKTPVLLSSFGEGVNRYIAILCAIWASRNGILLIDEIENGIHYSNYNKLWRLINQASEEANCQLFITSHSKECIEAFCEEQKSESASLWPGTYYEMYRNVKKDTITVTARDHEQLYYTLTHNGYFRGE